VSLTHVTTPLGPHSNTLLLDVIKYFGFELGAQTNTDPADDRWIINGAHEASKLQDYLDGFITKFVLCKKCRNPETEVHIKDGIITLPCKACGHISDVDLRAKLSSFILKNQPKKGKKDKSNKKAERKARKARERANGGGGDDDDDNEDGSPNGSEHGNGDDNGDDEGDVGIDAGSDDELTRRINAEAKEIDTKIDEDEIEWTVDTSEEAVKARAKGLPDDLKRSLVINGNDGADGEEDGEEGGSSRYEQLGTWIEEEAKSLGGVAKVNSVEVYKKAQELGMEKKHRTLTVLAQALFDENIITKKQIELRVPMLKKMITSEKHEKAFLGGTERLVGVAHPELIPAISTILMQYYEYDLIEEDTLKAWGGKASKKYVDLKVSRNVRKSAEKFMTWLEEAESEEEEDGDDESD